MYVLAKAVQIQTPSQPCETSTDYCMSVEFIQFALYFVVVRLLRKRRRRLKLNHTQPADTVMTVGRCQRDKIKGYQNFIGYIVCWIVI